LTEEAQAPKATKTRNRAPSKKKAAPVVEASGESGATAEAEPAPAKAPRKAAKRSPRKKAEEESSGE